MMKNILGIKNFELTQKSFAVEAVRNYNGFSVREHFPEINRLKQKYIQEKMMEDAQKNFICKELIEECGINSSSFYLAGFERQFVLKLNFSVLKRHGLIKKNSNETTIVNNFLKYLEPFPFDDQKIGKCSKEPTVLFLRDSVERQYLAWKYKVDLKLINDIMFRFQPGFFIGRSLRSIQRNCNVLELMSQFTKTNLPQKIYLINQQPFSVPLILNFGRTFENLNWNSFRPMSQRCFQYSFNHIHFLLQVLENKFTKEQIKGCVPFLNVSFSQFINKINIILSHPSLSRHKNDNNFLHLLRYYTVILMNLENFNYESFDELKHALNLFHSKFKLKRNIHTNIRSIRYQISNYFEIDEKHLEIIKRHPKYSMVTEEQLLSTLQFLLKKKFTKEEILDSIIIVLYPSHVINRALHKIAKEEKALINVGILNGCVYSSSDHFKFGTKSKRKTLQLCLYYIEKEFNFSWEGVLNFHGENRDELNAP